MEPTSLQEAIIYFADPRNCREYLMARRWPDGVTCPTCGGSKITFSEKHNRWQCASHHAKRQFTLKTGTIFEDSALGLDKWLAAMWMVVNCKNGVSSYEIARDLKITQKSTWFMLQRLRDVMQDPQTGGKISGEVEVDETFIGGKARNMHADKRARRITGTGGQDKATVVGVIQRGGKVRTKVVRDRKRNTLQGVVREHVEAGAAVFTDALPSYVGLTEFQHQVVDHAVEYVRGTVHTNTMENFWSLVKRQLHGTYISVEPFHLFRYLDEQTFRYNNRKMTDAERFDIAVKNVTGKRLTWNMLTAKNQEHRPLA